MSYHNGRSGNAFGSLGVMPGGFLMNPDAKSASTSTSTTSGAATTTASPVTLSKAQATAMQVGPVASEVARPESLLTAQCADYRYVVNFKPLARTGILPAGTPMVGGVKISWNPSVVGTDFPKSWLNDRNRNAGNEQAQLDKEKRTNPFAGELAEKKRAADSVARSIKSGSTNVIIDPTGKRAPETLAEADIRLKAEVAAADARAKAWKAPVATSSAFLTDATKAFLIGYSPQGPNSAVLVVGAVSTRDVDVDSMMGFLKRLLMTGKRVEGGGLGLMAFATVPKLAPGQAATAPVSGDYVQYEKRIPGYSIDDARAMAIAAALSKREALQVLVSGEIFGKLAVAKAPDLFIEGELAVKAAIDAIAKSTTVSQASTAAQGIAASAIQEAEAAKAMSPEEGDAACAAILERLNTARSSISSGISAEQAKLAAGPAALAAAQASANKFVSKAHGAEEEVKRLIAERIQQHEAAPAFKSLSSQEQFAVRCIMQQKAASLVTTRADTANARITSILAIKPEEFAASIATANQAYTAAQAAADTAIADAIAKVEEVRRVIALPFYMRKFAGLPVWAWGAGGATLLIGGAVFIRMRKKKKSAASAAGK